MNYGVIISSRNIMNAIKKFFLYLSFFILGSIVGFFTLTTVVGYSVLQKISHPETVSDFNLSKTAELYSEFTGSLNQVDDLIAEIDNSKKIHICKIICDSSSFVSSYDSYDSSTLKTYYSQNPKQALKDPDFRLLIDKLHRYSRMLPNNTKDAIRDLILSSSEGKSRPATAVLSSAKIQMGLVSELPSYLLQLRRALSEEETIDQVRDLRTQCVKSGKTKKITEDCNTLMAHYGVQARNKDTE